METILYELVSFAEIFNGFYRILLSAMKSSFHPTDVAQKVWER